MNLFKKNDGCAIKLLISRRAQTAMGTLIIFIALVLTAAVAASVLIGTISSLQARSLETGRATTQEIGTNFAVLELVGERDSTLNTVTNLSLVMRLAAGSQSIPLSDVLFTMTLSNGSAEYNYNVTQGATTSTFNVSYAIQGSNPADGYLTRGDVAKITFNAPRGLTGSENIRIGIVPMVGTPYYLSASLPDAFASSRVIIYP